MTVTPSAVLDTSIRQCDRVVRDRSVSDDLDERHAESEGDRRSGGGVGCLVLPDQRNDDVRALGACAQHEHRMAVLVDLQLRTPHVGVRRLAERDDAGRRAIAHAHDARVVGVEHGEAVRRQRLDELPLRDGDVVLASELPEVGDTDVEDEADRRSDHGREVRGCGHAHEPPSRRRGSAVDSAHAERCQGRADLVVERAGRCDRLARCARAAGRRCPWCWSCPATR